VPRDGTGRRILRRHGLRPARSARTGQCRAGKARTRPARHCLSTRRLAGDGRSLCCRVAQRAHWQHTLAGPDRCPWPDGIQPFLPFRSACCCLTAVSAISCRPWLGIDLICCTTATAKRQSRPIHNRRLGASQRARLESTDQTWPARLFRTFTFRTGGRASSLRDDRQTPGRCAIACALDATGP
jgi:hypothetical protein